MGEKAEQSLKNRQEKECQGGTQEASGKPHEELADENVRRPDARPYEMNDDDDKDIDRGNQMKTRPECGIPAMIPVVLDSVDCRQSSDETEEDKVEITFEKIADKKAVDDSVKQGKLASCEKSEYKHTELEREGKGVAFKMLEQEEIRTAAEGPGQEETEFVKENAEDQRDAHHDEIVQRPLEFQYRFEIVPECEEDQPEKEECPGEIGQPIRSGPKVLVDHPYLIQLIFFDFISFTEDDFSLFYSVEDSLYALACLFLSLV